jgi:hypothetical protein
VPALGVVVAALVAAAAFAGVTVYSNDFSSGKEAKELRHAEGKHCKKQWRKKSKSLRIAAKRGRTVCGYRPPVQGDSASPDHTIRAKTKLSEDIPKKVRDRVYVGVAVRSGHQTGYELQVYPSKHRFRLVRRASSDNVNILAKGRSKAINGVRKPNRLQLTVHGSRLKADANGKRLAKIVDRNSGQVDGRKLEIMVGYQRKRNKPVSASFDDLEVQVPKP